MIVGTAGMMIMTDGTEANGMNGTDAPCARTMIVRAVTPGSSCAAAIPSFASSVVTGNPRRLASIQPCESLKECNLSLAPPRARRFLRRPNNG